MKKQHLGLESLSSGKFAPLSANAMQQIKGGTENATQGGTATVAGQQVPFDHDTMCQVNGKDLTQYFSKDDKLLANHVGGQNSGGGVVITQK